MINEKIKFKDLSGWLKVAIIGGWLLVGYFVFLFIFGFIVGLTGG